MVRPIVIYALSTITTHSPSLTLVDHTTHLTSKSFIGDQSFSATVKQYGSLLVVYLAQSFRLLKSIHWCVVLPVPSRLARRKIEIHRYGDQSYVSARFTLDP